MDLTTIRVHIFYRRRETLIKSIDVARHPETSIKSIDVARHPETSIKSIDVARHPETSIKSIDVARHPETSIKSIDVARHPETSIKSIDVARHPETSIKPIDVARHPETSIKSIDVARHPETSIKSIDVARDPAIDKIYRRRETPRKINCTTSRDIDKIYRRRETSIKSILLGLLSFGVLVCCWSGCLRISCFVFASVCFFLCSFLRVVLEGVCGCERWQPTKKLKLEGGVSCLFFGEPLNRWTEAMLHFYNLKLLYCIPCSKCYGFGTYFTHVQSCNVPRVQSATEWTALVHTSHMSKAVINVTRVQSATEWTSLIIHTSHMSKAVM